MILFDSIDAGLLPDGYSYGAYVGGNWPTYSQVRAEHPKAHVLSIAVNAGEDAECLDIENGDASPEQFPGWWRRQRARGVRRPCAYANASTMPLLVIALRGARIARRTIRLWSAHYTAEHICGPKTCAYPGVPDVDGTQWTSSARGLNLDQSLLKRGFFSLVRPPEPKPARPEEDGEMYLPLIPGQPPTPLTLWADTAAQGLPRAFRNVSIVLVGNTGAVVRAEFWGTGEKQLGYTDHKLTTGREIAITPPKGTKVIQLARTDTTATAAAAGEVFRY